MAIDNVGLYGPLVPTMKGTCAIFQKNPHLHVYFLTTSLQIATKLIVEILPDHWILLVDSWILRVAWNTVDPYVHSICDNTKELLFPPDEGFVRQINVTVGIALLVSWAARSNIIALRVLQQLIAGHDAPAQDWEKERAQPSVRWCSC